MSQDDDLPSLCDLAPRVSLGTIAREWTRLGCTGFGGPPTHITLLRRLCVQQRRWMDPVEFEDGIAATNLLPGPASTQLAIFCAWRLRGHIGGVLGGVCFIIPGLAMILILSTIFLSGSPPVWILGLAAGAGAAVPAVASNAAFKLIPSSWQRVSSKRAQKTRWMVYAVVGGVAAATVGAHLVLVLLACGVAEVVICWQGRLSSSGSANAFAPAVIMPAATAGGFGALAWVALKVGALSYGGGFVIIPLMQNDAVVTYHWMTSAQFLNAVALGQLTPGPLVQTVAVVGYAAGGMAGALLAALIAFAPSFFFVLLGGPRFDQIRANTTVRSFMWGAGPAVIGAIAGSALPLGLSLQYLWQIPVLAGAVFWLFVLRRGVVSGLLLAGAIGCAVALVGVPV